MGGGGFIQSMKNGYNRNRSILNERKSLRERSQEDSSHPKGEPLRYNKMNPEEYKVFKQELERKRKRKVWTVPLTYLLALCLLFGILFSLTLL